VGRAGGVFQGGAQAPGGEGGLACGGHLVLGSARVSAGAVSGVVTLEWPVLMWRPRRGRVLFCMSGTFVEVVRRRPRCSPRCATTRERGHCRCGPRPCHL